MTVLDIVYAALLLLGGIIGYTRARSAPSLGAGVIAAVLMAAAAVLLHHHPRTSLGLGIVVSLALGVFFLRRYQETRKPMPAMLVLAASVVVLIASVVRLAGVHF